MSKAFDILFDFAVKIDLDPIGEDYQVSRVGEVLLLVSRKDWDAYITGQTREELVELIFQLKDSEWEAARSYAVNDICDQASAEREAAEFANQTYWVNNPGSQRERLKWFRHMDSIRSV